MGKALGVALVAVLVLGISGAAMAWWGGPVGYGYSPGMMGYGPQGQGGGWGPGWMMAARDALLRYEYPGNVRELEKIVERAVLLCRRTVIDLPDLPAVTRPGERGPAEPEASRLPDLVAPIERQAIRAALERHGGIQTQAAAALGISERVLRYKLKKYGLEGRGEP